MSDNCHVEPIQKTPNPVELSSQKTSYLEIWGMGCPNCAARVRNTLVAVPGVIEAQVNHQRGVGAVLYNPTLVAEQDLVNAVARAGGDGRHEYGARLLFV